MSNSVINISATLTSDLVFMLSMLSMVMISACFLGRYVVITRKMVIATCGVLAIQIILVIVSSIVLSKMFPSVEDLYNLDISDEIYAEYYHFSKLSTTILNLAAFGYAFIFYLITYKEHKILRAIESTVCLYLYYSYVNSMSMYILVYIKGGKEDTLMDMMSGVNIHDTMMLTFWSVMITGVISVLLFFVLYFGFFRKKKFYVLRIRDRIIFVVWLFIFQIFPAMPLGGEILEAKYKILSYIFAVLIPILGGIAPIIMVMIAAEISLEEKNKYQENYLNAELDYIEQYKRSQTETRAFRHDIINNLSLTNMLLNEGKVDEASEHLKELLGNVQALSPQYITGDEMLDCIVAMKAAKMKEMDISFTNDGVIDGGLNMKPMDTCSIFANALDNAIEAAAHVESNEDDETKPWVDMKIKRTGQFFVVNISNSAREEVDVDKLFSSSGYTSKKDTEHHGFGLRNIRQTVEEYDGLLKAQSEGNRFELSIMIPR